jgi:hypothetical protein
MDVLLVSAFVAFILATLTVLVNVLSIFINETAINALFAVLCSAGGNLLENYSIRQYILHTIADAFLGRLLLTVAERVSTYRSTVINSVRQ